MKKQKKFYWRKLDDQAKVFALASSSKYSSIFRMSIVLKEKIEAKFLQKALDEVLKKYKAFKVKMQRGLFWYYFTENEKKALVSKETDYPFKKVNDKRNNDYLFKVTYFENKINMDFFHALTDGNGAMPFFREIVYKYLELKYPDEINIDEINENIVILDSENSYKKIYKKHSKKPDETKYAFLIKGDELEKGKVGINHFNINLPQLKKVTKEKDCSLSMYLTAMIGHAIYEANYKLHEGKKPINLCIPVNLKKYFPTETISNFFAYIVVSLNLKKNKTYSFDCLLDMVNIEFEKKLKLERMIETLSVDAGATNKKIIRIVPLFIKKIAVRIGSLEVKRHFTMTISNIGKFDISEKYEKYVENFCVMLSPDWAEKLKCGICSYRDNLVVSFGTLLKDTKIQSKFRDILIENNIDFMIEGNGVSVIS